MYKISINDHPFYLLKYEDADTFRSMGYDLFPYMGKIPTLLNAIDKLEKTDTNLKIGFYTADYAQLRSDFKSLYRKIKAMGGIVSNPHGEILFIYRHGMWDLPKGKIEKKESKKECAIREVQEETGLSQLLITSKIGKTRHTYRIPSSGERILKITEWYAMDATGSEELILQAEEGIEDAKWMTLDAFLEGNYVTFASITDILNTYRSMTVKRV